MDLFSKLNDRQKEVANTLNGPLLVIAGAGTGKTHALTYRIANLINNGILPWQILAITFTNKAAKAINERIREVLSSFQFDKQGVPMMGTFHSICVKILRNEIDSIGYETDFVIYDTSDQISAMKEVLKRLQIDPNDHSPKSCLKRISNLKNQLLNHKTFTQISSNNFEEQLATIYSKYQELLEKNNALDFDDIIMLTVKVFEMFPEILAKYQNRWKYISVDEYQDTNYAQHRFIYLLSKNHGNLCVIGDSDQSIYAFRGACITNILNFEKEYQKSRIIRLEQNYRSSEMIINAANSIIRNNESRIEKNMWTENKGGNKVKIFEEQDESFEASHVIKEIIKLNQEGFKFSDSVIMYRTNAQSRIIEEVLLQYQIPYKIIGGLKFYARKEIKDILAYLRIINNSKDNISLTRIINTPARKIGKSSLTKIQNFALTKNISIFEVLTHIEMVENLTSGAKRTFQKFFDLYQTLKNGLKNRSLSDFIDFVINETGYSDMLDDDTIENITRLENIEELKSVSSRYNGYGDEALQYFLEEVSLVEETDNIDDNVDSLLLMTIHSAKGLEFDNVFILGCEEGIFPHERSMDTDFDIEEERRLMYVAMTRAKQNLYITYAKKRMLMGQTLLNDSSRFVGEISADFCEYKSYMDKFNISSDHLIESSKFNNIDNNYKYDEDSQVMEYPEYEEGANVEHPIFGVGKIVAINKNELTISFGPGNVKKFMAGIAPLSIRN